MDEYERVCKTRKLKVNVDKSKIMFFERAGQQTVDFSNPYKFRIALARKRGDGEIIKFLCLEKGSVLA